jgi:hypothetical protein
MSQRVKVKEMVMQMHEKNLVLMNILRDIAESETFRHLSPARQRRRSLSALQTGQQGGKKFLAKFGTSCIWKTLRAACRHKPQYGVALGW